MSRRRRKGHDLNELAAELGPEDGSDPVEFHGKPWDAPKQAGRKGRQLCCQVKDALLVALAGCADEVLQGLRVLSVEPAPHTGRLRVLVATEDRGGADRALERAAGFLRSQVAAAVCRRHAPELLFEVL